MSDHSSHLLPKLSLRALAVTTIGSGTNNVVAALSAAAFDTHTVTVLTIGLASLFELEDVIDITSKDLSGGVVFNTRAGFCNRTRGGKGTGGERKSHNEGVQLPMVQGKYKAGLVFTFKVLKGSHFFCSLKLKFFDFLG